MYGVEEVKELKFIKNGSQKYLNLIMKTLIMKRPVSNETISAVCVFIYMIILCTEDVFIIISDINLDSRITWVNLEF